MTATKIDLSRPVRCRNGWKAGGTYAGDAEGIYGFVQRPDGVTFARHWTAYGSLWAGQQDDCDLLQEPVVVETWWQNIYPGRDWSNAAEYRSRHEANEYALPGRIACLRKETLSDGTHRVEVEKV